MTTAPATTITDPGLARTEAMLLGAGDHLSAALRRAARRVSTERYEELVDWAAHLRLSRALSHHTGAEYVDAVGWFIEWLDSNDVPLRQSTAHHVERWQQHLAVELRQSAETRHGKLVALRNWFGWREQYRGGHNPTQGVRGPRREQRMARKFSRTQLRAIFGTMDRETTEGIRDHAVLLFFLATGARRMETAGLRLGQLELRSRIGVVRFFGKGAKERVVTFQGEPVPALQAWLAERDNLPLTDQDAVFCGLASRHKGKPLGRSGLDGILRRAVRRARLRIEPGMALHTLRATYATALYDSGADLEEIRILMGHNDINTTRQYLAITERQLKTRLPRDFLTDVTGGKTNDLPLWSRRELERRGQGGAA